MTPTTRCKRSRERIVVGEKFIIVSSSDEEEEDEALVDKCMILGGQFYTRSR